MPDLSPPYHVESPAPGLKTGFCEAMTFFALANFCRFFTRGLRTLFDLRGVSPRFFRIARVSERGPSLLSSSASSLDAQSQVRRGGRGGWRIKRRYLTTHLFAALTASYNSFLVSLSSRFCLRMSE